MNHVPALRTASNVSIARKSVGASIEHFAIGGNDNCSTSHKLGCLCFHDERRASPLIFLLKHHQKHQQIRMSSPQTTQPNYDSITSALQISYVSNAIIEMEIEKTRSLKKRQLPAKKKPGFSFKTS
jgi:hypothetical protein